MKKLFQKKYKKSESGMALVESLPVLFTIIIIFNFTLGFFGAIHSGILNSIASYNYTMETFRFRSNLIYFRPGGDTVHYLKAMNRVHGTIQDGNTANEDRKVWPATIRPVTFTGNIEANNQSSSHKYKDRTSGGIWSVITSFDATKEMAWTPEIWVKTVYGICLNADCVKK